MTPTPKFFPAAPGSSQGVFFLRFADAELWDALFPDDGTSGARCACCGAGLKMVAILGAIGVEVTRATVAEVLGVDCYVNAHGNDAAKAAKARRNEWRTADGRSRKSRDYWLKSGLKMEHGVSSILPWFRSVGELSVEERARVERRRARVDTATRDAISRSSELRGDHRAEVLEVLDRDLAELDAILAAR
jgi:hypothetical protein